MMGQLPQAKKQCAYFDEDDRVSINIYFVVKTILSSGAEKLLVTTAVVDFQMEKLSQNDSLSVAPMPRGEFTIT